MILVVIIYESGQYVGVPKRFEIVTVRHPSHVEAPQSVRIRGTSLGNPIPKYKYRMLLKAFRNTLIIMLVRLFRVASITR